MTTRLDAQAVDPEVDEVRRHRRPNRKPDEEKRRPGRTPWSIDPERDLLGLTRAVRHAARVATASQLSYSPNG